MFKVETIGDCYVAVTGLPEPNKDHAVLMSRFAWEIKLKMHEACKKLEATLGPGTAELSLRIGLHSGPVTAGVLRGEKSRFQLFGDTMNTAARMESLSLPNSIQVSQTTASLLISIGKQHWLTPRDVMVEAKGKGTLQTYWLRPTKRYSSISGHSDNSPYGNNHASSLTALSISSNSESMPANRLFPKTETKSKRKNSSARRIVPGESILIAGERRENLIKWNVEVLIKSLQKVVAMRHQESSSVRRKRRKNDAFASSKCQSGTPIEELTDIIELPEFNSKNARQTAGLWKMDAIVEAQLLDYVTKIASMYRNNPFHNFEHASHVTMSASKLMNRIMVPEDVNYDQGAGDTQRKHIAKLAESVHTSTFGISSDALAQLAIVFSALIHDVDHTGLTNAQLVKEGADVAVVYNGQSVAEQNSVTLAWSLLLEPQYEKLFHTICPTQSECKRFRQLVVAAVLATDIIDSDLQKLRKNRWDKTFQGISSSSTANTIEDNTDVNRKATIVIEHLIQASDVAHTMQHWHIYCRWNEKLFQEKYRAFLSGHEEEEPSERWYENELGFFDHYVIPLAKKLKECGVFGVSSDEYLGFAIENRMEWEVKGQDVVAAVFKRAQDKYGFPVPFKEHLEDTEMTGYEHELLPKRSMF